MDDTPLRDIADAVKALAIKIAPDLTMSPKYGGDVMVPDATQPNAFVAGVFVYTNHVSVEFSDGAAFDDPDGLLEGKGKARRHLKLEALSDIDDKSVETFLRQALA